MRNRKVTISIQQIKIFGGVFLLAALGVFGFAFSESGFSARASQDERHNAEESTPTPFLPSSDANPFFFDNAVEAVASPMSRPTIVYENGVYPPAVPEALPTFSDITPYSIPEGINPLTGLPPASPELLNRRPVASKITLYPRVARPQYGLTLADVVFEYYIEDGLTRFIAVFYGNNPTQIGPVRSGRFFDEHVVRMYQAYLVFKYADPRVYDHFKVSDISEFLVVPLLTSCSPFFIGKEHRDTYNNIFFNLTRFGPCLEEKGYDNSRPKLRAAYFSVKPPSSGQPALAIYTYYSVDDYHYWGYEPTFQRYYRQQDTHDLRNGKTPGYAPLIDNLTGQQVSAENVVFLFISHSFADQWQAEDEVYHIDPTGSGKAYLFRDGVVVPAFWRRIATDQPLELTDLSGMPLPLKPGRTFYEVLREESLASNDGSQWHFQFEP